MQKRHSSILFHFENGLTCCVSKQLIKKIEQIQVKAVVEPLMRKDLVLIRLTVPLENSYKVLMFFLRNLSLVLDRVGRESRVIYRCGNKTKDVPTIVYKVLVSKKNTKEFLKRFFTAKLTPPGREWMVLQSTPTAEAVKAFRSCPP